jgi:glycosyltransferase involved in cell wall biosynthesis
MTTVSVIIPCYNHAAFLDDAIRSVRHQRWPSTELIVVDDGSSDNSAAVAREFLEVRLIRQTNQGLSAARNVGLNASSGDIVIFLDADDVLLPNAIAAAVETLDANRDAMMAFGRLGLMDVAGRPLQNPVPRVTANFYEEFLRRNYIRTPAMAAFRRTIFDLVGAFDPTCSPSADYDLYLRIARRFPIAAHETLVARYRQHAGSMSRNARLMLPATLRVLKRQRQTARRARALRAAYRFGLRRCREFYGEQLVEQFRRALRTPDSRYETIACAVDLIRLYPQGVAKHVIKKIALTLRHAGRATADADTAAPSSRASAWPGSR